MTNLAEDIIEVVCTKNPAHNGTAIGLTFQDGGTCHSHAEMRANARAAAKDGAEVELCTQDDECDGTIKRA